MVFLLPVYLASNLKSSDSCLSVSVSRRSCRSAWYALITAIYFWLLGMQPDGKEYC